MTAEDVIRIQYARPVGTYDSLIFQSVALAQEDGMNADVLTTGVADGIAVITLGSARRIHPH